jgi:hypothetical protein
MSFGKLLGAGRKRLWRVACIFDTVAMGLLRTGREFPQSTIASWKNYDAAILMHHDWPATVLATTWTLHREFQMAGSEQTIRVTPSQSASMGVTHGLNQDRVQPAPARLSGPVVKDNPANEPGLKDTPGGGKESGKDRHSMPAGRKEVSLADCLRRVMDAIEEAARNRGREANALKSVHDYLTILKGSGVSVADKVDGLNQLLANLGKIKDWDKPQWLKTQQAGLRDAAGKPISEHELIKTKNRITDEQMAMWDAWAAEAGKPFAANREETIEEQIAQLDDYIVKRVALDSVKNWLRRRPSERFINDMFAALATNKLYIDLPDLRIKAVKDESGQVRGVELRDGTLFFEGSDEAVPLLEDPRGRYIELPDDSDMIVFEKRTLYGQRQIVPVSQPNGRDPNIQWFNGAAVKRGWQKEQRFFNGPDAISIDELYGFFPEHFPMRLTNSQENRMPTEKVGGAIYGYAREHAGRQSRHLIAEFGQVMPGLKRNNSQLINDARQLFGLQKHTVPIGKPSLETPQK